MCVDSTLIRKTNLIFPRRLKDYYILCNRNYSKSTKNHRTCVQMFFIINNARVICDIMRMLPAQLTVSGYRRAWLRAPRLYRCRGQCSQITRCYPLIKYLDDFSSFSKRVCLHIYISVRSIFIVGSYI